MINKENIQKEVDKTLQSLDGVNRAVANPFLFTRIKARMQKQSGWERTFSIVSRPAVALAIVILVMSVNTWVLWGAATNENSVVENATISEIANEYILVASVNNYDYEIINQ